MDELFYQYEKLVYHIANKYQFNSDREDLYQAGMLGLKKALINYDPLRESDITNYICLYIKGEILKEVNGNKEIKVGRDMYKFQQEIKKAREELTQEFGRCATDYEVAYFLNEDVNAVLQAESLLQPVYHFDASMNEDDVTLYDKIAHIEQAYDAGIMDLKTAYEALEEEEKSLINSRYYEDKTQSETAKILGMTQVQVSRSESKILQKLKTNIMDQKVA